MLTKESISNYTTNYSRILMGGNDFIYIQPNLQLIKYISNYTITFPSQGVISDNYVVMPHGSATLVLSCTDSKILCNLFGPITKPAFVGHSAKRNYRLCHQF